MASQVQNESVDENVSCYEEKRDEAMETDESQTVVDVTKENSCVSVSESEQAEISAEEMKTVDTLSTTDQKEKEEEQKREPVFKETDDECSLDTNTNVAETRQPSANAEAINDSEITLEVKQQLSANDAVMENTEEHSPKADTCTSYKNESENPHADSSVFDTVESNNDKIIVNSSKNVNDSHNSPDTADTVEAITKTDESKSPKELAEPSMNTNENTPVIAEPLTKLADGSQNFKEVTESCETAGSDVNSDSSERLKTLSSEKHTTEVTENIKDIKYTAHDGIGNSGNVAERITAFTEEKVNSDSLTECVNNALLKSNENVNELSATNSSLGESVKDTFHVTKTLEDSKSLQDINGSLNIETDTGNTSTKATLGDSSCDNLSMSGVSISKSGGGDGVSFPVDKMDTDESDMNLLKEERVELYLESMRNVNETDRISGQATVDVAGGCQEGPVDNGTYVDQIKHENDVKEKEESDRTDSDSYSNITESNKVSKSEIKEQGSKHVSIKISGASLFPEPGKGLHSTSSEVAGISVDEQNVSSDRSTESSNGEKSQTDMEVANIMKKGLREEGIDISLKDQALQLNDSPIGEQNEDTKIPDVEIDPQNEKEIWKADREQSPEKNEEMSFDSEMKVAENVVKDVERQKSRDENSVLSKDEKMQLMEVERRSSDDEPLQQETEDKVKADSDADKDTLIFTEKETDFAFVKLPVSNRGKKDSEQPREILKRKMFDEFTEDSSNSSWYIIKDKRAEDSMDTDDKNRGLLVTDESSNLSAPDDSSLASAGAMEDSRLSFTDQVSNIDETSNLSAGDSCSVKAFGHELVLDESANLNPPDKDLFVQPSTPSSVVTDATSEATPVKRYRRGTLAIAVEEASEHGHNIKAKDLFEYQWPQESGGDWYMLQEQISTYLEVKSFKRKYPDLFRRVCDKTEKDFLREKGVVSETQSDLGLTALKSEEVHELISKDYPSKYREYCTVLHEKEKEIIASKQKDYVLPKLEKSKMREYTLKAMKSTSEWNRQFLKERNEERRAYFDMQTFAIQYPKSKFRKVENIRSSPTAYPVPLIPGQFQEYCRKYSAEELKYFPLNTAMFDPPKKLELQDKEAEQGSESQEEEAPKNGSVSDSGDESSSESGESEEEEKGKEDSEKEKEKSTSRETSAEKNPEPVAVKEEPIPICRVCSDEEKQEKLKTKRKNSKTDEELIHCSECKKSGHPSCLDLTDAMLKVIKTYPWQCMECKTCVECMDPYDEDKMLFCDHCDRGYHTFCVGLKSLPTGKWECVSCRGDSTPVKPGPKPQMKPVTKGKRGRKPKDPNAR